jgi:molybdopterin molybdotransferase
MSPHSNPSATTAGVLSFPDARHAVEEVAGRLRPTEMELLELELSPGRVLAEEMGADRDFPPFPRAARDGYAVRAADVASVPARLRVVGEVRAGVAPDKTLPAVKRGEAAEITTGAPAPEGTDAVVMVEYTAREHDTVEVQRAVSAGENIVPTGSEARRGDVLLAPGSRLTPAAVAAAASVGRTKVTVYAKPRVAILATGDELVDVAAEPGPYQIRNSNSYSLAAQVQAAGGQPVMLPIAPDEPVELRHLVQEGLASDLLLLTGGVSMGKYDLVEQVLHELGAEFFFTGAMIQPGRPIVFGRAAAHAGAQPTCFFGLPGNPVSTMVTFEIFARVVLEALSGVRPQKLAFVQARLKSEIKTKTGLTRFLPAVLSGEFEGGEVELVRWQGSGDIAAAARANCYLVVPPDREKMAAGEMVAILLR